MSEFRKYKQAVAIVLLAVYAFIATPTQLWHHHHYLITSAASSLQRDKSTKITSSDSSAKASEDNCQICGHHYSFYSNDEVTDFNILRTVFNPNESFYALAIPSAPYFNSANKGPPFQA